MFKVWVDVFGSFNKTRIFVRIWILVAGLALYATLAAVVETTSVGKLINIHANFHTLLGLALGLLLVFRTNTAYDRWWEGRKLWGQLVNESRNLAIKVRTCVSADADDKHELEVKLIAFAYALKEQLRGGIQLTQLEGFATATATPTHVPAHLAKLIYEQFERWRQTERLGGFELLVLDRHASALMDVCGACERIRKTPISTSYRWFVRQSIAIYLLTLPWGLVDDLRFWTIPAVALIGYFMLGIELLAEQIEEPFGTDDDDLLLDDICRTIKKSVNDIFSA